MKSNASNGLRKLVVDELKNIYWTEKALTKVISKMIDKAVSMELTDTLMDHLQVTIDQVTRLEEIFSLLEEKVKAEKCQAIACLLKETEEEMKKNIEGAAPDAGIIFTVQKLEHYQIATYGALCAFAQTLREEEAAFLLEATLKEEKEISERLSGIAIPFVHNRARGRSVYVLECIAGF